MSHHCLLGFRRVDGDSPLQNKQKQQGQLFGQHHLALQKALKGAEAGNLYNETVAPSIFRLRERKEEMSSRGCEEGRLQPGER